MKEKRCRKLHNSHICGRLLFKGFILKGHVEIKCPKCKNVTIILDGEEVIK